MIPDRFVPLQEQGKLDGPAAAVAAEGFVVIRRAADPSFIASMSAGLDDRFAGTPF